MRERRIMMPLCLVVCLLLWAPEETGADLIKFKTGGVQQCVVIEETEDTVCFLSSMGVAKMPLEKIESIKRESDDVNAALEEKWKKKKQRKRTPREDAEPAAEPEQEQKTKPLRTYDIRVTIRRIVLGGRKSGVEGGQQVADFVIEDMGVVNGSRLFNVDVTSYKTGKHRISATSFYAMLRNGLRIDPEPLSDYPELAANLGMHDSGSGYVAFPTDAKLEELVVRSSLADFDLDLETGQFTVKRGPF